MTIVTSSKTKTVSSTELPKLSDTTLHLNGTEQRFLTTKNKDKTGSPFAHKWSAHEYYYIAKKVLFTINFNKYIICFKVKKINSKSKHNCYNAAPSGEQELTIQYNIRLFQLDKLRELGTNGKRICDFLLVNNSNFDSISYRFWDRPSDAFSSKIAGFTHCTLIWRPPPQRRNAVRFERNLYTAEK